MIPLPDKKYNIIYADPAWDISGYLKETKKGMNNYDLPYDVITDDDIIDMPVKNIVSDWGVLFMWCVDSKIPIMPEIMEAWGFEYKCLGFIWHKSAKKNNGDCAPFPNFTRRTCEYCFLGVSGKYKMLSKTVNQMVSTSPKKHSAKPVIFKEMIVNLCGDVPRIELFGRDKIEGWDVWGNQIPNTTQTVLNKQLVISGA